MVLYKLREPQDLAPIPTECCWLLSSSLSFCLFCGAGGHRQDAKTKSKDLLILVAITTALINCSIQGQLSNEQEHSLSSSRPFWRSMKMKTLPVLFNLSAYCEPLFPTQTFTYHTIFFTSFWSYGLLVNLYTFLCHLAVCTKGIFLVINIMTLSGCFLCVLCKQKKTTTHNTYTL